MRSDFSLKNNNSGAMDLVICGTTVRNKDEEFETFWDLREYRMGDCTRRLRGLLSHSDRQMLFPLVFLVNAGP